MKIKKNKNYKNISQHKDLVAKNILNKSGKKYYSQNDEDGILLEILNRIKWVLNNADWKLWLHNRKLIFEKKKELDKKINKITVKNGIYYDLLKELKQNKLNFFIRLLSEPLKNSLYFKPNPWAIFFFIFLRI